jgi:hypothetical protein
MQLQRGWQRYTSEIAGAASLKASNHAASRLANRFKGREALSA